MKNRTCYAAAAAGNTGRVYRFNYGVSRGFQKFFKNNSYLKVILRIMQM
jgi:hypothetical protein